MTIAGTGEKKTKKDRSNMIRLEKKAIYYLKGNYHHESKTETRTLYDMKNALELFKNMTPKYYINKKDFSIVEEITLYYNTDFGIKCYYKKIDAPTEEIETNYKED